MALVLQNDLLLQKVLQNGMVLQKVLQNGMVLQKVLQNGLQLQKVLQNDLLLQKVLQNDMASESHTTFYNLIQPASNDYNWLARNCYKLLETITTFYKL